MSNITDVQKNDMEDKEPIDLIEGIYLPMAFKYSKYQICKNHFITLY